MATAYTDELRKLAAILDEARQEINLAREQSAKPKHLYIRTRRAAVQAARAVVAAAETGCQGLLPNEFVSILAREADGAMSDGTAFMVWTHFIGAVIRSKRTPLKADAGAFDFPKVKTDNQGRVLGRDGEPPKGVWTTDPETGRLVQWELQGEAACVTDDYDQADTFEHLRRQAADWSDCCAVAADVIRAESRNGDRTGLNWGSLMSNVASEEPDDLRAASLTVTECVHYASQLRRWADAESRQRTTGSLDFGPDFLVDGLLEAHNKGRDANAPVRNEMACASQIAPPAYGGVDGASFHAIALDLAGRVLTIAADAIGTIFSDGVNPDTGLNSAKIIGWREGFQQCALDDLTGAAVPLGGERVRVSLHDTDFRHRLQAMPTFNEDELVARMTKESALASEKRRARGETSRINRTAGNLRTEFRDAAVRYPMLNCVAVRPFDNSLGEWPRWSHSSTSQTIGLAELDWKKLLGGRNNCVFDSFILRLGKELWQAAIYAQLELDRGSETAEEQGEQATQGLQEFHRLATAAAALLPFVAELAPFDEQWQHLRDAPSDRWLESVFSSPSLVKPEPSDAIMRVRLAVGGNPSPILKPATLLLLLLAVSSVVGLRTALWRRVCRNGT